MTATAARRHVTPLVVRQHNHVKRIREGSARQIRGAFGIARDQARPHIQQLTHAYGAELARRRHEDEEATVSLVWIAGALILLHGPLTRAIGQAALAAQAVTIASQTQAINDGQEDGRQRVKDIAGDVAVIAGSIALSRFGRSGYNRQLLSHYYASLDQQAWQKAQKAAMAGAANGMSEDALEAALASGFDSTASYALLVDETEIMAGYRDGLFASYNANPDSVAGWMRVELGPDPCPECEAANGSLHPLDEDFDSHPRCWGDAVPLTLSDLESL